MIYRSDDIPQEYNKLAEISDNYLVWVRESTLKSGTNYSAYIQFLRPSVSSLLIDNYKITTGTSYTLDANYETNGMYNYLDSYDVSFSRSTMVVDTDELSNNDYDRADSPEIFICQLFCVFCFVWILNQLTKIVRKDGALH